MRSRHDGGSSSRHPPTTRHPGRTPGLSAMRSRGSRWCALRPSCAVEKLDSRDSLALPGRVLENRVSDKHGEHEPNHKACDQGDQHHLRRLQWLLKAHRVVGAVSDSRKRKPCPAPLLTRLTSSFSAPLVGAGRRPLCSARRQRGDCHRFDGTPAVAQLEIATRTQEMAGQRQFRRSLHRPMPGRRRVAGMFCRTSASPRNVPHALNRRNDQNVPPLGFLIGGTRRVSEVAPVYTSGR
jgi:hypothetical protein